LQPIAMSRRTNARPHEDGEIVAEDGTAKSHVTPKPADEFEGKENAWHCPEHRHREEHRRCPWTR
jgi:hypothetical protein